jgi:hypothetical protein
MALVRLATDLRQLERYEDAPHVLDLATELPCSDSAELAAYICDIAVQCDRADYASQ